MIAGRHPFVGMDLGADAVDLDPSRSHSRLVVADQFRRGPVLARFGAGWIPWGPAAADPVAAIEQMKSALLAAGADPQGLQVVGALPVARDEGGRLDARQTAAHVPRLAAAGVTDFRISTPLSPDRAAALDDLTALVGAFRRVADTEDTP